MRPLARRERPFDRDLGSSTAHRSSAQSINQSCRLRGRLVGCIGALGAGAVCAMMIDVVGGFPMMHDDGTHHI